MSWWKTILLCLPVCFRSEEVKILIDVFFLAGALDPQGCQEDSEEPGHPMGSYLLALSVMSKVLRGGHSFLFRPSCVFLASIPFTVL